MDAVMLLLVGGIFFIAKVAFWTWIFRGALDR
jgi:hypothetical protein